MQTEKKHTVITGGTGSLGSAFAKALQAPDWQIEAPGKSELDVCNPDSISRYFENRGIDLLICAAGITRDSPLLAVSETTWDEVWNVNFKGAAACASAVLAGMRSRKRGHIIFIGSYSAIHPPVGQVAYAAAKAALLGLVADLASQHGASNIRINGILPGFLQTRMTENVSQQRKNEILAAHTLGRLNTCEDAAAFVRFLHFQMPNTSGQIFQLDNRVNIP
ncbi:MAG: SDR family NAD(P)-dependent oxidoreductase [Gloeobacteraceae cyanobacterium ES-bin-144]|nr:SDR family NAD(P)-dependent oxidoreductase [Verrucomicrobiales bacterium]